MDSLQQAISEMSSVPWFGLEMLAKSLVILTAAMVVAGLLRKRSAASRHLILSLALAVLLLIPLLPMLLPTWQVELPPVWAVSPGV